MKKSILSILLLSISLIGFSQKVFITGRIVEEKEKEFVGIPGVDILINKEKNVGTTTNMNGEFFISIDSVLDYSTISFDFLHYTKLIIQNIPTNLDTINFNLIELVEIKTLLFNDFEQERNSLMDSLNNLNLVDSILAEKYVPFGIPLGRDNLDVIYESVYEPKKEEFLCPFDNDKTIKYNVNDKLKALVLDYKNIIID